MSISMPQSQHGPRLLSDSQPISSISQTDTDGRNAVAQPRRNTKSLDYVIRSGVAGGLAGCAAKTLIAPLDRVKILFQASSPQFQKYTGSWFGFANAARIIYNQDGLIGLFRGHSMTLIRVFPYAAIKFIAYEQYRAILITSKEQETMIRRTLSGSMAGVTTVFFTYPLELMRVRLAFETRKNYKSSISMIFRQIYHEQPPNLFSAKAASPGVTATLEAIPRPPLAGLANFYRGFTPTLLGILPYAGTSFLAHDMIGDVLRSPPFEKYCVVPNTGSNELPYSRSHKTKLNTWAQLFAGGFAGLLAQTASYPLEIIRRRMQVGGAVGDGRVVGIAETAKTIFRERGFRGFYVGLSIGFVKVGPMMA
ncbi:Mitoferrin [Dactylella cylindrospora]|nr:Mitoferrin [Dactylella cylindrospora]